MECLTEKFIRSLEYSLCTKVAKDREEKTEVRRAKRRANLVSEGCQTAPELGKKSIPDLWFWPRRVHPVEVLKKPAKGTSYVVILKKLKKRANLRNWAPLYRELGRPTL